MLWGIVQLTSLFEAALTEEPASSSASHARYPSSFRWLLFGLLFFSWLERVRTTLTATTYSSVFDVSTYDLVSNAITQPTDELLVWSGYAHISDSLKNGVIARQNALTGDLIDSVQLGFNGKCQFYTNTAIDNTSFSAGYASLNGGLWLVSYNTSAALRSWTMQNLPGSSVTAAINAISSSNGTWPLLAMSSLETSAAAFDVNTEQHHVSGKSFSSSLGQLTGMVRTMNQGHHYYGGQLLQSSSPAALWLAREGSWSRVLRDPMGSALSINTMLIDRDTIYIGGSANSRAFLGTLNATTGKTITCRQLLSSLVFKQLALTATGDVIAVGSDANNDDALILRVSQNITVTKKSILFITYEQGNGFTDIFIDQKTGAIQLSGYIRKNGHAHALAVAFNEELQLTTGVLPSYVIESVTEGAMSNYQFLNLTNQWLNLTITPLSPTLVENTHQLIVNRNVLTQAWPPAPTSQPSSQPSRQPSSQPTFQPTARLPNDLRNGLVAYYSFNGNADDESGNGNNGVVHSAVLTADRHGVLNSAYSFNGVNAYIEMVNGGVFNFINNFSIAFWVCPGNTQVAIAHMLTREGQLYFEQSGANTNSYYLAYYDASNNAIVPGTNSIASNTWNHFVLTKENHIVQVYLNNQLVQTVTAPATTIRASGNQPLVLGAFNGGSTRPASALSGFLNGNLDDIFIYGVALSKAKIAELYGFNLPTSQPSEQPSNEPSSQPSEQPTLQPSVAQKYLSNTIDLTTLTNTQGFPLTSSNNFIGYAVSGCDFNGDGRADIVLGAPDANAIYVVYGGTSLSALNVENLSSSQGVKITGSGSAGYSISCADVNGDGKADLIIGAPTYSSNTGVVHVVYGNAYLPNFNLANLGNYGISIWGSAANDYTGRSVSHADVNGDGKADVIIGAPQCITDVCSTTGKAYVIFGGNTPVNITLTNLMSPQGFTVIGAANSKTGYAVSGLGDINHDGFDEFSVISYKALKCFILYGNATFSTINLASLLDHQGFYVSVGDGSSPWAVSGVGDINHDNYTDFAIAGAFSVYVIFGKPSYFNNLVASSLTIDQGFAVTSSENLAYPHYTSASGRPLSSAGDFNGDGYDDIIFGNAFTSTNNKAYIIFGKQNGFSNIAFSTFTSDDGIVITGTTSMLGWSASNVGDINHDGFSDVIIGSNGASASYVIYGGWSSPTSQPSSQPSSQPTTFIFFHNIVINPGAELGMTGWTTTGVNSLTGWVTYSNTYSGSSSFLTGSPSPVSMSQNLSLAVTSSYKASFVAAPANPGPYTLSLTIGDTVLVSLTNLPNAFTHYTAIFAASRALELLQFTGSGPIWLDDIVVYELEAPTSQPSSQPNLRPTSRPSSQPSVLPSSKPSRQPSSKPSRQPSSRPSLQPSSQPTHPTGQPTERPTGKLGQREAVTVGAEFQINTDTLTSLNPTVTGLIGGGFVVTWQDSASSGNIHGRLYLATGVASGSEFQVNNDAFGDVGPTVAGLTSGGFVVTWRGNSDGNIHGQLYLATGVASGSEFQVNTDTLGSLSAKVTGLTNGGFVVTWQTGAAPKKINGQVYSAAGITSGSEFQVSADTLTNINSKVAGLTGGGFVVTWQDNANGNIHGKLYSATGVASNIEFQVNTDTLGDITPTVAGLTSGGFVVAWRDNTLGYIHGQVYSVAGVASGSEFQVNTDTASTVTPAVAGLVSGGFVVTWRSNTSPSKIKGQLYLASGVASGSEFQVNTDTLGDSTPAVAGLTGGEFVITWSDGASPSNIHGQLFNCDMSPTSQPSNQPSNQPSREPSTQPVSLPSAQPSSQPSVQPSRMPTKRPSTQPTRQPTVRPSRQPTVNPTAKPSRQPSSRPSKQPVSSPSSLPSGKPSMQPSRKPSGQPSIQPSGRPSSKPSGQPSGKPSKQPSRKPSAQPSSSPSVQPYAAPSFQPFALPTTQPSSQPSVVPSWQPSDDPSTQPSSRPSAQPSRMPTKRPTGQPTRRPTVRPSRQPSSHPTAKPSRQPSGQPSRKPSSEPSVQPSVAPSTQPSSSPSVQPYSFPSFQPFALPTTQPLSQPSVAPSGQPSDDPSTQPSVVPSVQPSDAPSTQPSTQPSRMPTKRPTGQPTRRPTVRPSRQPSSNPTAKPSRQPSGQPSRKPSGEPSVQPSVAPSRQPSNRPSDQPSSKPSLQSTSRPSTQPSDGPAKQPSSQPSVQPSRAPTRRPSGQPTRRPTVRPSRQPSSNPTTKPSRQPSDQPSMKPSSKPSVQPSVAPSRQPSSQPSVQPYSFPSFQPFALPTTQPSSQPSTQPSRMPTKRPTGQPTRRPTVRPSRQPSRQPSSWPSGKPSAQPSRWPTSQPSRRPNAKPSGQPSSTPSVQPSVRPSPHPSISFAPTLPVPSNWTAQVSVSSSFNYELATANQNSVVCGGVVNTYCLQLSLLNGAVLWGYRTPWFTTNAIASTTGSVVIVVGQGNGVAPYVVSAFDGDTGMFRWISTTLLSKNAQWQAVDFDSQLVVAGYNDARNAVAGFVDPNSGVITAIEYIVTSTGLIITNIKTLGTLGSCMGGYTLDIGSSRMILMFLNSVGSLTAVNTLIRSDFSVNLQWNQINQLAMIDSINFAVNHLALVGTTSDINFKTNAFVAFVTGGSFSQSVKSFQLMAGQSSQFNDVMIDNACAVITGSYVSNQVGYALFLKIDLATNTLLIVEGITAFGDSRCHSMVITKNGYQAVCHMNSQLTVFSLDTNLRCGKLPPGFARFALTKAMLLQWSSLSLVISNVPLSTTSLRAVPANAFTVQTRVAASGLAMRQLWPENLPTRAPTFAPSMSLTLSPTPVPMSAPSPGPTSFPSESPAGVPSLIPLAAPTSTPSALPSAEPSSLPSSEPSSRPTSSPTATPHPSSVLNPTPQPIEPPTLRPTRLPTSHPTTKPTLFPTSKPTLKPTPVPMTTPSNIPTELPSLPPVPHPSPGPSELPSPVPSESPTLVPVSQPSTAPVVSPSERPTSLRTAQPTPRVTFTFYPTMSPSNATSTSDGGDSALSASLIVVIVIVSVVGGCICCSCTVDIIQKTEKNATERAKNKTSPEPRVVEESKENEMVQDDVDSLFDDILDIEEGRSRRVGETLSYSSDVEFPVSDRVEELSESGDDQLSDHSLEAVVVAKRRIGDFFTVPRESLMDEKRMTATLF